MTAPSGDFIDKINPIDVYPAKSKLQLSMWSMWSIKTTTEGGYSYEGTDPFLGLVLKAVNFDVGMTIIRDSPVI